MTDSDYRCVPTVRVKAFIEQYAESTYPEEGRWEQFSKDCGVTSRQIYNIRTNHRPNVNFDMFDRILTRLNMIWVWRASPEDGGFADYYLPDVPPEPAKPTMQQSRSIFEETIRRARGVISGRNTWLDEIHERALEEENQRTAKLVRKQASLERRRERQRIAAKAWRDANPELARERSREANRKHYHKVTKPQQEAAA